MDLDLRPVRAFVATANIGHVGRAADQLGMAQPSLSRMLDRLERSLGVELFERCGRGIALSNAGRVFLNHAIGVLEHADVAVAAVRATDDAVPLRVGFAAGVYLTPALLAFNRAFPATLATVRHLDWRDQRRALTEWVVDVAAIRMPIDTTGLVLTPLYDEERVVALPLTHRLAGRAGVHLAEIASLPVCRHADAPTWDAFWRIDPRPDGSRAPDGPIVDGIEEKLEQVALGNAIAILPVSAAASYLRPDVATPTLIDVEPARVALASRAGEQRASVEAFTYLARSILRRGGDHGRRSSRP